MKTARSGTTLFICISFLLLLLNSGVHAILDQPIFPTAARSDCDCGVRWQNLGEATAVSVPINFSTILNVIEKVPLTSVDQGQFLCYSTIECRGFAFFDPWNSDPVGYLFGYPTDITGSSSIFPEGNLTRSFPLADSVTLESTTFHLLSRYELYPCTDFTLDPYYFYFGDTNRRLVIESLSCPYPMSGHAPGSVVSSPLTTCCWHQPVNGNCTNHNPPSTHPQLSSDSRWQTIAQSVWETYGAAWRMPPNANCVLLPTLWTYDSQCTDPTPGCFAASGGGIPCSEHGHCTVNRGSAANALYSTPNYCKCFNYTGTDDITGGPLFDHISQYMGRACQYASTDDCTDADHPSTLCSGNSDRCIPQLVANTPPLNDYHPHCDCSEPVTGVGQYCETNRCDTANGCQSLGGQAGRCIFDDDLDEYRCDCTFIATGDKCQYDASACRYQVGDTANCDSNGVCMPPHLSGSIYGSIPNYQLNSTWCMCTAGLSHGTYCEEKYCDPNLITAGRAVCDVTTGLFQHCLEPYASSGLPGTKKCDIDRCAVTGGAVAGNPPSYCDCGSLLRGTDIDLDDITCYPRCANYSGVVCGPDDGGLQEHSCEQTTVLGVRYAQCSCDFGYILEPAFNTSETNVSLTRPPPNQGLMICVKFCYNGGVTNPAFSQNNQAACDCTNTGYSGPRCDVPICKNNGTWNTLTESCVCSGPYTSLSHCTAHTCANTLTPFYAAGQPGFDPDFPSERICLCNPPYTWANTANRLDCMGSLCGTLGTIRIDMHAGDSPETFCTCSSSAVVTRCFDPNGHACAYCQLDSCQNGGAIVYNGTHASGCSCPFPYTGSSCASHLCGSHGTPEDRGCACDTGWNGTRCTNHLFTVAVSSSSSSSSSTGMAVNVSSSSSSSSTAIEQVVSSTGSSSSSTATSAAESIFGQVMRMANVMLFALVTFVLNKTVP